MLLLTNSKNHNLSIKLAENLKADIASIITKQFSDGELSISLDYLPADKKIILLYFFSNNVNDDLISLFQVIELLSELHLDKISLVLPYLCYSRHDRKTKQIECIPLKMIGKVLTKSYIKQIITLDLHNDYIKSFFQTDLISLSTINLFYNFIVSNYQINRENYIIVAPDEGAAEKAQKLAEVLNINYAIIEKTRDDYTGKVTILSISSDVKNKICFILDDIIDTGETVVKASNYLISQGANSVEAFCTHPVLSNGSIKKIEESLIKRLIVTDSFELKSQSFKITVISNANLISGFYINKVNI